MSQQFDELAKSLASGISRREALRRFAGGVAGTALAWLGMGRAEAGGCPVGTTLVGSTCCPNTRVCNTGSMLVCCAAGMTCVNGICQGQVGGACLSNYQCPPGALCCNAICRDVSSDEQHCGACGHPCAQGQTCVNGVCQGQVGGACTYSWQCPVGWRCCGGICRNVASDPNNCGACGHCCPPGFFCHNGCCICCPQGTVPCGNVCCPSGTACRNGVCVCPDDRLPCGPNKVCCLTGQTCINGVCVGQVGGACTSDANCPPGSRCCSGICRNVQNDNQNCGACGHSCPPGFFCHNGCCVCCPAGYLFCGNVCINPNTDESNCGQCGRRCPVGAVCVSGHCICPNGRVLCGHTATNPGICCLQGQTCPAGICVGQVGGACLTNQDCPPGALCCNGICRNVSNDPNNCGVCGNVCQGGTVCVNCCCVCPTGTTLCGNVCVDKHTNPAHCGACGNVCPSGTACRNGVCVCPDDRLPCGPNKVCCLTGQTCIGGVCVGQVGGACLDSTGCPPGSLCCNNICRNVQNDPFNCGACGRVCPPGWFCHQGCCVCNQVGGTCPPGTHLCGNVCVNLSNDERNCGACGRCCPGNSICWNGGCYCPAGTAWSTYWQKCIPV